MDGGIILWICQPSLCFQLFILPFATVIHSWFYAISVTHYCTIMTNVCHKSDFHSQKNYKNQLHYTCTLYHYKYRPLFINSLWPNESLWWHRFSSTLAQVMACSLKPLSEAMLSDHWWGLVAFTWDPFHRKCLIRKSKDYVYGVWVYKVLGIWKGYYRVKKSLVLCMKSWTEARNDNKYMKSHSKLTYQPSF